MDPPEQLRASARERILGLLAARLHFADDEKRHPEIVTQEVGDALVVCGLPRTGTTIVYDLLCLDPAARAPRDWESSEERRAGNEVVGTCGHWWGTTQTK